MVLESGTQGSSEATPCFIRVLTPRSGVNRQQGLKLLVLQPEGLEDPPVLGRARGEQGMLPRRSRPAGQPLVSSGHGGLTPQGAC